jgi:hypothetical protein
VRSCAYCEHPDVIHVNGECQVSACACYPPCWICNRPNERARGYDDPNEAEACGTCELEYRAYLRSVSK